MNWYEPLKSLQSKGSLTARPGSLAGLHEARKNHQGQFFTPDGVASFMWRLVEPAMQNYHQKIPVRLAILDNSVGSGKLLQFADPEHHEIYGLDVDENAVAELGKVAESAGFRCHFEAAGMEACRVSNMDLAIINPPFSIQLQSPTMEIHPDSSFGKFGPGTSALSHAYALYQALDAARVVVALLPATYADEVANDPDNKLGWVHGSRLAAHFDLPAGSFKEEGTEVAVSVLVFSGHSCKRLDRIKVSDLDEALPDLDIEFHRRYSVPKLRVVGTEDEGPSITMPVTGDLSVRVAHNGRRIHLSFHCGLTEAKVLNAIYRTGVRENAPADHRHPKGFRYSGQGVLDVEVHLAQDEPLGSFEGLISTIHEAGGVPEVDPGLMGYIKRRIKHSARQAMPLRHTVWIPDGVAASDAEEVTGVAKRPRVANPKVWGSPLIKEGEAIVFTRNSKGGYDYTLNGKVFSLSAEDLFKDFDATQGAAETGWVTVHEGLAKVWPELEKQYDASAKALGIDQWLNWGYQYKDLLELAMKPQGALIAWKMGLGKARLSAGLILLIGCRHGLVVTEAGLVDEMVRELEGLPISRDEWQVIREPEQLQSLRRINVISYERLRMKAVGRKTYGRMLRRRIGVLCADEGDVLANPSSEQSRALVVISARRRFLLTGTLTPNYPRQSLPMLALICGDGTAAQPWGLHRGKLETNWAKSVTYAERGIDAFREKFVTTEWVTRAWEDDLLTGAKREIPKIANIEAYRAMLAPHVKRRIDQEPEVAAHISIPVPTREVVELDWDDAHLGWYLKIAEQFAAWYSEMRRRDGKQSNLISILARIRAVQFAANYPQHGVEGFGTYGNLTSKQRWVVEELERLSASGAKTICYVENPGQVELYARLLKNHGVESVRFHGEIPVKQRMKDLDKNFRFGNFPVLLATLGVTAKGLNIHQSNRIIMANRSWSATTEEQSIARVLRPQQQRDVLVQYPHLRGSIDEYQAQLVAWKADTLKAGLDWATPETDDLEFNHLDTILTRFCEGIAELKKVNRWDLKDVLLGKAVA